MNKFRKFSFYKIATFIFAIIISLSIFSCNTKVEKIKNDSDIKIVFVNDVHGGISDNIGYAGLAGYRDKVKNEYPYTLLVDAGDFSQGAPSSTFTKASEIINIMNAVNFDFVAVGNHDFDHGVDILLKNAKNLNCGVHSCNIIDLRTGKPMFEGYKVFPLGSFKVGFVAVTTPETLISCSPSKLQDENKNRIVSFSENEDGTALYKIVQENVDKAKNDGANFVFLVGHLGENGVSEKYKGETIVKNISGIDGLIDGHSHEILNKLVKNKDGKEVPLVQVGTKLTNIGLITIDKDGKVTVSINETAKDENGNDLKNTEVSKVIAKELDSVKDILSAKISHTDYLLTINDKNGKRRVRKGETNLGDLSADAMHNALGGDCILLNGGAIRDDIKIGDIKYEDILRVFPFGNECTLVRLKGSAIKDALELNSKNYPEENGGFFQVSGINYTVDSSISSSVVLDEKGDFVKVAGEYRVKDIIINGEELDVDKDYEVGGLDFIINECGGGCTMFKNAETIKDRYIVQADALANFVMVCDMEKYKNIEGDGRIIIK